MEERRSLDKVTRHLQYATPQLTVYGTVGRVTRISDKEKSPGPGDGWAHDPDQDQMHPGGGKGWS